MFLHRSTLSHVHEGNDQAVDLIVDGPVRTHPQIVPAALPTANLAANWNQVRNDQARVLDQSVVFKLMGKIRDWAPFIARPESRNNVPKSVAANRF